MFEHEDAIGIGILIAVLFKCYYIPFDDIIEKSPPLTDKELIGTGRGGDANANGDYGKPFMLSESSAGKLATGEDSNLSGGPGTLWGGGYGLNSGGFGYGGHGAAFLSAGGGGGWYGGGSSFLNAGGGGGSSFCLEADVLGEPDYTHCPIGYSLPLKPDKTGPDTQFCGWWDRQDVKYQTYDPFALKSFYGTALFNMLNGAGPKYYDTQKYKFDNFWHSVGYPEQALIAFNNWKGNHYGNNIGGKCIIYNLSMSDDDPSDSEYKSEVDFENWEYTENIFITEQEFTEFIALCKKVNKFDKTYLHPADPDSDIIVQDYTIIYDILANVYDRYFDLPLEFGDDPDFNAALLKFFGIGVVGDPSDVWYDHILILNYILDKTFGSIYDVYDAHQKPLIIRVLDAREWKLVEVSHIYYGLLLSTDITILKAHLAYLALVKEGIFNISDDFIKGWDSTNRIEYNYTGNVQVYEVPHDGEYIIHCYGAPGGDALFGVDEFMGGPGGYCTGRFNFRAGTKLYIYVGQKGNAYINSPMYTWNGGGGKAGACTSGGGATDVRWDGEEGSTDWQSNLYSRFIVAGGGGGVQTYPDETYPEPPSDPPPPPQEDEDKETKRSGENWFLISDKSIVYVDVEYTTTLELPDDNKLDAKLFIDGEYIDIGLKKLQAGRGYSRFVFNLSDYLEKDTTPYWAKLEAELNYHPKIFLTGNGLRIIVETRKDDTGNTDNVIDVKHFMERHKKTTTSLMAMKMLIREAIVLLGNVHLSASGLLGFREIIQRVIKEFELTNVQLKATGLIGALSYINERLETFDLRNSRLKSTGLLGAKITLREFIETVLIGLKSSYTALLGARIKLVDTSEPEEPDNLGDETLSITETVIDTFETFYNIIKDSNLIETVDYVIDTLDKSYGIIKDSDLIETEIEILD